jgi:formate dehydrogenase subunit gamma
MPLYERWDSQEAARIVSARASERGATIPIFHALMERFGYVDRSIVPVVAEATNLSRAEIHGTLTFYHDFRDHPPGRHTIKVCRAEACQSRGALAMHESLKRKLGVDWHGTTADGAITIEPVYCLGLCACAPAMLVDDEPVGNVDAERLDEVLDEVRA